MAKTQTKKATTAGSKDKNVHRKADAQAIDLHPILDKFFWLVIPVFAVLYYFSSKYSLGFYQDDEIGQYINMIQFWHDPSIILGNYPKPGYKIFMVIPGYFSYDAVLFVNSLIASVTVYLTYVLLKVYNIRYAFFGALLLAFQPLFYDLSFRSYAEIFTSLCIVGVLILYRKEKYFWSALLMGYIFTIRQEIALLIIVFAIIFFRKKEWTAIIGLAVFPILYNLLGYMKTGSPLFILDEMKQVAGLNYQSQGLFHYFKVYIFIIGPVALTLFLAGFFGFFSDLNKYKDYIKQYYIFYLFFVTIFVIQMMTMFNDGPNPGNWRYLLHISPVAAVFATIGLNNLAEDKFRKTSFIVFGVFAFLTLVFLSRESDGFRLLDVSEYSKFLFVTGVFLCVLLIGKSNRFDYLNKLSLVLLVMSAVYFYYSFKPKVLSPENQTVKQVAEFIQNQDLNNRNIYVNHTLLRFFADKEFRKDPKKFIQLNTKDFANAKPGDLIVWESHYGYRPEFGNDINIDKFQNNPDYKLLNQFASADKRFVTFVFEKIN